VKLSDIFFAAGIVIAVIGAGTGLFPVMGVGAILFLIGMVARYIERTAGGQAQQGEEEHDTDA
jgi:hypothetical protein